MKTNPLFVIVLGLVLLGAGVVMQFTGGPPHADASLVQKCHDSMSARGAGADMAEQCSEVAFATAMTATDAGAAARAISAANRSEIGGNALAMFLIGIGLALTIGGLVLQRKR